jgi:hypothetical protein
VSSIDIMSEAPSSVTTSFTCSRCGYKSDKISTFKLHLSRKTDCKPQLSDIAFDTVKEQYASILRPNSPGRRRRRKKMRPFGAEKRDHIKRDMLKHCVADPLQGVQTIIQMIYCNNDYDENKNIRMLKEDENNVEVYMGDVWSKKSKRQVFDKLIYMACDILEYNVPKKYWTTEFTNFVNGMGEMDNDDLLELIREEVETTFLVQSEHADKQDKQNTNENKDSNEQDGFHHPPCNDECGSVLPCAGRRC